MFSLSLRWQRYEARHIANYFSLTIARNAQRSAAVVEILFKSVRGWYTHPTENLHAGRCGCRSDTELTVTRGIGIGKLLGSGRVEPPRPRSACCRPPVPLPPPHSRPPSAWSVIPQSTPTTSQSVDKDREAELRNVDGQIGSFSVLNNVGNSLQPLYSQLFIATVHFFLAFTLSQTSSQWHTTVKSGCSATDIPGGPKSKPPTNLPSFITS